MSTVVLIVVPIVGVALVLLYFVRRQADTQVSATKRQTEETLALARVEMAAELEKKARELEAASERTRNHYEAEAQRAANIANERVGLARDQTRRAEAAVAYAQEMLAQKLAELATESDSIRQYYEKEALSAYEAANQKLQAALAELAPLRGYASLHDAESEVRKTLTEAIAEAAALRREAQTIVDQTRNSTAEEWQTSQQRAKDLRAQAETYLVQATRDAGRIVEAAERRAEQVAGDAYIALRDKHVLQEAIGALWNEVNGYGDRYVIPTRSVLDDLAEDFSHTKAGAELKAAREQSRRLVELKLAAACNYEEEDRRDRANRFVIDAFNGRVDAILSRTKLDNYGTLEQEIRDAFRVVNLNGLVFRDARILPSYLDARLAELKWAVVVQELKAKEREEQRAIQEQIREEEKARRDYERALQEAAREEAAIKKAMESAREEAAHANAEERAKLEAELAELNQRLTEAEAKGQRALSMAQQTRAGNIYVISNVGSFGDGVLKIGMTRRLIPEDRIKELSDASVPFGFDVHAMIRSDDAPALERMLHQALENDRLNKVNYRKEFFRVPLERLRALATEKSLDITFTIAAEAREYRETLALEKMPSHEREKYQSKQIQEDDELPEDSADLPEERGLPR